MRFGLVVSLVSLVFLGCNSKPKGDLIYSFTARQSAYQFATLEIGGRSLPFVKDEHGTLSVETSFPRTGPLLINDAKVRFQTPCETKTVPMAPALGADFEEAFRREEHILHADGRLPTLPEVTDIWVDGEAKTIKIGDVDVPLMRVESESQRGGVGHVIDPGCRASLAVTLDGAAVGSLPEIPAGPGDKVADRKNIFVAASKDACYAIEEIAYGTAAGGEPRRVLQGSRIDVFVGMLSYFMKPAPEKVTVNLQFQEGAAKLTQLTKIECPAAPPPGAAPRR